MNQTCKFHLIEADEFSIPSPLSAQLWWLERIIKDEFEKIFWYKPTEDNNLSEGFDCVFELCCNSLDSLLYKYKEWKLTQDGRIEILLAYNSINQRLNIIVQDNGVWNMNIDKSSDPEYLWWKWTWVSIIEEYSQSYNREHTDDGSSTKVDLLIKEEE
jgi:hypothetical protein